ncbi:DivIVA domain-containing protein [Dactylosporangium sp. CA-092794]|uniref:DivIVA domain-containing protein n=1 Tax=Dactylosporangium sp. CA-092794 TaxID=3239929 RepID=UPI003D91FE32
MSAVVGEIELRPENGFELSLRGYHRAQVDRYIATLQMRLTTAETELASARYREQQLAGRVERLSTELKSCKCGEESSKVVGGRIQRMIELAEEEAGALRAQAQQDLENARAAAEALLSDARKHAEDAMRDFQLALSQRRAEEARAEASRRAQWDARRQRQREAAENLLATTRSVGSDSVQVTRRLLDALIEGHTKLLAEVEMAEKEMANLSSA